MIEKGLYVNEDKEFINFSEYRTIILYALRLKEFDWTERFIEKYKNYHDPLLKKNILNYSLAILNFETKNYENSIKLISVLKTGDVVIKMDLTVIQLMTYYELNYTDNALSLIDSYRHYLIDNKILSKEVINNNLNFLKYYKILLLGKIKVSNKTNYRKVISDLNNQRNTRRREWLLEKLENELAGSKKE